MNNVTEAELVDKTAELQAELQRLTAALVAAEEEIAALYEQIRTLAVIPTVEQED